jgi:predicted DNA-binding transcriptional regulator AlpA
MKTMSRAAIAKRYGVDNSTAYGWTKMDNFPESAGKRKHGALVWNANEVYDWVRTNRPNNKIIKVAKPTAPVVTIKTITQSGKTTLDVILFLLENDKAKQKLVLDILLD